MFQSTRPRGARLSFTFFRALTLLVSIHAPTWGATTINVGFKPAIMFQSTRPRGARQDLAMLNLRTYPFQSTRPRGARRPRSESMEELSRSFNPSAHVGRDGRHRWMDDFHRVSIHAPTWGATELTNQQTKAEMFQSTRPRGARLGGRQLVVCALGFNPRAHVGRDILLWYLHRFV